jgi:mycothiol synthase
VLDVDTASKTGAHTLYERLGFRATQRQQALVRRF